MRLAAAALSAATAVIVLAGPAGADRPLAPGPAFVTEGEQTVRAQTGSYCVTEEPRQGADTVRGVCADAVAPRSTPRPRLEVAAGDRLRIELRDRPGTEDEVDRLSAGLVRVRDGGLDYGPRLVARRKGGSSRIWNVRLPNDLERANALDLFAELKPNGDASYLAGLRAPRS